MTPLPFRCELRIHVTPRRSDSELRAISNRRNSRLRVSRAAMDVPRPRCPELPPAPPARIRAKDGRKGRSVAPARIGRRARGPREGRWEWPRNASCTSGGGPPEAGSRRSIRMGPLLRAIYPGGPMEAGGRRIRRPVAHFRLGDGETTPARGELGARTPDPLPSSLEGRRFSAVRNETSHWNVPGEGDATQAAIAGWHGACCCWDPRRGRTDDVAREVARPGCAVRGSVLHSLMVPHT